jgi:hypothetical protein
MHSEQRQDRNWFREGNIQERVIEFLEDEEGFTILSPGHSVGPEQGLEIVAERYVDGIAIHRLVLVLGWPGPVHEQSESQGQAHAARPEATARSWIAQTLLDLALGRGDSPDVELGLALPAIASYIRYLQRLRWFLAAARVYVYLVSQAGGVAVTLPGQAPASGLAVPSMAQAVTGTRRKLGLPGARRLEIPLLHVLAQSEGELGRSDAIALVARWFPEVPQPIPAEFGQRVSIAQWALQEAGQSELSGRGVWKITAAGRARHDAEWADWESKEEH